MKPNLPYGRQTIEQDDVDAVIEVLRSDWLTTGPAVERFEKALAQYVGAAHAVAVCNGTAALHTAMHALGIREGDEVIVPAMSFAATANAVLYQGGTPVFADVEPNTLLIDPADAARKTTSRTKAIVGVDYAGQTCDWATLRKIADRHHVHLLSDACHALGATFGGRSAGTLADLSCFSFHPVKPITTGEGGMIVTDNSALADRMRVFRNHGISTDHRQREKTGTWHYEMRVLGFNYRITDLQCALGLSQLAKYPKWLKARQDIADLYDALLKPLAPAVRPLVRRDPRDRHAFHLYVVRVPERQRVFDTLRSAGIGVNVHYIPIYMHPYYRDRFGDQKGFCPNAEAAYAEILSLPIFPAMLEDDVRRVVSALKEAVAS